MNRIDFIDSLAGEAAFAVQILISVRNRASVNVEAGFTRVDRSQPRIGGALHTHADARLQNPVAGDHDVLNRIDDCLIQGMREGSHHAVCGAAGKFRVGIKRDDIPHRRQDGEISLLDGKAVVLSAQQLVQVEELAAFALPAHPPLLARVVYPMAMEQEERSHLLVSVFFVQLADQARTQIDQRIIFGCRLIRVRQIGQQSEMNVGIVVAEEANFEILDQSAHLLFI